MEDNKMKLMVECEECKQKFTIGSEQAPNSLTNKKEFKVNGQSIFLTYYDCPFCSNRHFVQIDDANSLSILRDVTKQFARLANKRRQNKEIPEKQSTKFKKSRQHLSNYRLELMKEYTGKVIQDELGVEYTLRFSV